MGNPSRTPQNSIFEPLFSHEEHLLTLPTTHLTHSSSSEWLTSSTYSSAISPATCNNQLRKSPATTFISQDMMSTHPTNIDRNSAAAEPATSRRHANCGSIHHHHHGNLSSSSTDHGLPDASMPTSIPPSRSFSLSHVEQHDDDDDNDDGSVATKLLACITKSISSPSLLSCCKESARETPYQKTLKLRMMKLQHCAEELGSESSDGGNDSSFDSLATMAPSPQSAGTTMDQRIERTDASPMMISVRSAPNLRCSSLASTRHSSHVRSERSFPPPLTHTLPRSASSDSFAYSLRAYREDGRFMLKEVKVPCRQYLQANRKDGHLTLQLIFTADDDDDVDEQEEVYAHKESEDTTDLAPREGITVVDKEGDQLNRCSYGDKLGVESAGRVADVGGGVGVIAEKESVHVIMDEIADCGAGKADDDTLSQSGPLCTSRPDLNGAKRRRLRNQPSIVCLRILSSPWKLNSLPPGNIPRLKVGPVTTFSQCDQENLVLQRRLSKNAQNKSGVKAMLGRLEMVPDALQGGGISIDNRGVSRTIVFKDVGAKSLMEIVTKLVSSLGLEGGKWCHTKAIARGVQGSGFKDGTRSIDIAGVRKHKRNGATVESEGEPARRCINVFDEERGGFARINTEGVSTAMSTTVHIDVQVPWVHSLHCKELFGRNQFGSKGFSWVAIRT